MVLSAEYNTAIKDVRSRVAASGTSFSAGMSILPKERRNAMYALYAFCREVDDIADDGETKAARQEGLRIWRERISNLFQNGKPEDSITQALLPAIRRFKLVEIDFQDIINGMAMDAEENICAPDMAKLDSYCDLVASAVGRVSVRIFGENSDNGMKVAHHLGRALQLTNILRDLAEDAERGRLYLPEELLAKHKVSTRIPKDVLSDNNIKAVCRDLASHANDHFLGADNSINACSRSKMRPAIIMRDYYFAIFNKLVEKDWKYPFTRVSLSRLQKLWLALKHLFG